jgi:hypothetical protein
MSTTVHWGRPDIAGDLVATALALGAAAPREIHVRPELYGRMVAQMAPADRAAAVEGRVLAQIPLVVDPGLPACPGFEIVRARPDPLAA